MSTQRPSRHRSRRGPLVAFVVVLLLIVGLIVADRVVHQLAEQRVAANLKTELNTPTAPDVQIRGIPFLTQLASRHYGEVDVQAVDVPAASNGLGLDTLDLVLRDVRGDSGYQKLQIGQVSGRAGLSYASLSKKIGQTIAYAGKNSAGHDTVKLTGSEQVFGQTVSATVVGEVALNVSDQSLSVTNPALTVGGVTIPANTASALLARLVPPISVKNLPFGVTLQSIAFADSGVTARVTGQNLSIATR